MKLTLRQRSALIRGGKILVFAAAVLGTTKLTLEFASLTSASTAAFSFLIIVLLSAFFGDLPVAIATSVVATLCFDYFYLPPVGTFNITAFSDWISLAAFLLASVIISRLTASAAENRARALVLGKSLAQLKDFGQWLLSVPNDQLTLSGIANEVLRVFSLEYCSIHVYGEGRWHHFTGAASSDISRKIQNRLEIVQDHSTDLAEMADENVLGVLYLPINQGNAPLALLAVKSATLPAEAAGTLAYLIGVKLSVIVQDHPSPGL